MFIKIDSGFVKRLVLRHHRIQFEITRSFFLIYLFAIGKHLQLSLPFKDNNIALKKLVVNSNKIPVRVSVRYYYCAINVFANYN